MGRTVIRVLDFETTGAAPPAHVVEVGVCDLVADGEDWWINDPRASLCGGGTITAETRAIHHISPVEIMGCVPFDATYFVEQAAMAGVTALRRP